MRTGDRSWPGSLKSQRKVISFILDESQKHHWTSWQLNLCHREEIVDMLGAVIFQLIPK